MLSFLKFFQREQQPEEKLTVVLAGFTVVHENGCVARTNDITFDVNELTCKKINECIESLTPKKANISSVSFKLKLSGYWKNNKIDQVFDSEDSIDSVDSLEKYLKEHSVINESKRESGLNRR